MPSLRPPLPRGLRAARSTIGLRAALLAFLLSLAAVGAWTPAAGADEAARQAGMVAAMKPMPRSEADVARDAAEKPQAIADLAGLRQGMKIADVHAGDGYVTDVLMRNVLPYGKLYANNDPALQSEPDTQAWKKRLEDPDAADLASIDNPLIRPLPFQATSLNAVFSIGAYHEAVARGLDRRIMNQSVFDALAPGGFYVIADARAPQGSDDARAAAACRTRAELVREEVEAVGFRMVEESSALAVASDKSGASACDGGRVPDRFLMKFERPPL